MHISPPECRHKHNSFILFLKGSRACMGKHLARMELFIFLGTLIQRFEMSAPEGKAPLPTERVQTGITCQPKPFSVRATPL